MSLAVNRMHGRAHTASEGFEFGIAGLRFNIFDVNDDAGITGIATLKVVNPINIGGDLFRLLAPNGSGIDVATPIGAFNGEFDAVDYTLATLASLGLPPDPAYPPEHKFLTNIAASGVADGTPFFLQCFNFGAAMIGSSVFPFTTSNPLVTIYRPVLSGMARGWKKIDRARAEDMAAL